MEVQTQLGPGWQIWMHVDTFYKNPDGARKTLTEGDWDAVVIQPFGESPLLKDNVRKSVFNNQEFDEPRDVSDLASAGVIMDTFLSKHPDRGCVFIYCSWPGIPGAHEVLKRVKEETEKSFAAQGMTREEVLKKVVHPGSSCLDED